MQNGRQIGCWTRQGATLTRSPAVGDSFHFWADIQEIEVIPGRELIVLIGESTARGYFYDPVFSPAEGIEQLIAGVVPPGRFQILDLARTNASMEEISTLLREVATLRPRVIVIWAGNNWFPLEDGVCKAAADVIYTIREGATALELRVSLEDIHKRRVQTFIAEAAAIIREINAQGILVIPEFNLSGWFDALSEPPPIDCERRVRWIQTRQRLLEAEATANREALADELISIDEGLGSLGLHVKAKARIEEDPARARVLLEQSRDAELWPKSPRCHRLTSSELRERGAKQGFAVVDLPRLLADSSNSSLPARELFLDYCHHSHKGLRHVCAFVAESILRAWLGISTDLKMTAARTLTVSQEVEACAQFLAAVHNSAHRQGKDILDYHIERALETCPKVATSIRQYVYQRLAHAPAAFATGHLWDRQTERYFGTTGLRQTALDVNLVNLILAKQLNCQAASDLFIHHVLSAKPIDLLAPQYGQLVHMDESQLETCAYHRNRRSVSSFVIILGERAPVNLDLSYRTPGAGAGAAVRMTCRDRFVALIDASNSWKRVRLTISAAALEPGVNLLNIEWPSSELDSREILANYAEALELGESPAAPYPILGEIFTFRASL
jgi:hypothetical protein